MAFEIILRIRRGTYLGSGGRHLLLPLLFFLFPLFLVFDDPARQIACVRKRENKMKKKNKPRGECFSLQGVVNSLVPIDG